MRSESLVWFLLLLALFGLIVGAIGRLLVPGPTRLGVLGTMAAGIAGALIGGFVGRLLLGPSLSQAASWLLSILGAALVVAVVSRRDRYRYGLAEGEAASAYETYDTYETYEPVVVERTAPLRRRRRFL